MDNVYIMTNEAYKGLIKIGKAKDPFARAKELSKPTGVPAPFSVYAYMEVPDKDVYKVERFLHDTLGMWVTKQKEFFKIAPEKALQQFQCLADLNGYKVKDPKETDSAPVISKKNTFALLGIKPQTTLYFLPDSEVTCVTLDDKNSVLYDGKKTTLSGIGKKLLGHEIDGFTVFSREENGEPLYKRNRKGASE